MTTETLLPPNATPVERALEAGTARLGAVKTPIAPLLDPYACPLPVLPWLAWGFSVDSWDADWSEAVKRAAVAESIEIHRRKGTRLAVEMVLERFDDLTRMVEWHEASPRATPHTFDVILPMVAPDGSAPGGKRATAAFAEAIMRDVERVKPLREHMRFVQEIAAAGAVGLQGVVRALDLRREDAVMTVDTSPAWALYLQTENGEPIEDPAGSFLDTAP